MKNEQLTAEETAYLRSANLLEENEYAYKAGDLVIAIINGEATLKRFYLGSNGIELHPRNKKYEIIYVNEYDDFQIQGLVQGVFRNY